jgi:hypothetical protein
MSIESLGSRQMVPRISPESCAAKETDNVRAVFSPADPKP